MKYAMLTKEVNCYGFHLYVEFHISPYFFLLLLFHFYFWFAQNLKMYVSICMYGWVSLTVLITEHVLWKFLTYLQVHTFICKNYDRLTIFLSFLCSAFSFKILLKELLHFSRILNWQWETKEQLVDSIGSVLCLSRPPKHRQLYDISEKTDEIVNTRWICNKPHWDLRSIEEWMT